MRQGDHHAGWNVHGIIGRALIHGPRLIVHMTLQVPVPILITREGKRFVASSPILDVATQGLTEKEVKENLVDLINEYLRDPDTRKPSLDELMSLSLSNIPVKIPESILHGKTSSPASS